MPKGVYAAASAMWVEARALDVAARNLAHGSTSGYRREIMLRGSFAEELAKNGRNGPISGDGGSGVLTRGSYFSQAEGMREATGAPLDLALSGDAFYQVQDPQGRMLLTRAANFRTDQQGRLVTPDGWLVQGQGGAITIPAEAERIVVDRAGRISIETTQNGVRQETVVDQLRVSTVADPRRLAAVNGQCFDPAGQELRDATAYDVHQGTLEKSNVEPILELAEMISIQRRYDAAQKALREQTASTGLSDVLRGGG